MTIARAAYDFFSSVGAAGHHEKRRCYKRPERQLCDSGFPGGNGLCGVLGEKGQRTQFLLFVLRAALTLGATMKRARSSKNTRVISECKKNLHATQIILCSYSGLCMSYYGWSGFYGPTVSKRSLRYRAGLAAVLLAIYLVQEFFANA